MQKIKGIKGALSTMDIFNGGGSGPTTEGWRIQNLLLGSVQNPVVDKSCDQYVPLILKALFNV